VLKVVGSLLASAVFLLVMNLLLALKHAPASVEQKYFESIHGGFGIKDIYRQRGGADALALYEKLLDGASSRIWAITNRRFVNSHFYRLEPALNCSVSIKIKIVFADPSFEVSWAGGRDTGINLQMRLEQQATPETKWKQYFEDGPLETLRQLPSGANVGDLEVMILRSICFSTCFVIDDDVFFFPMLAGVDSGQDPTIHVGAHSVLGRCVIKHMECIFHSSEYCELIYSNKNPAP